MSDNLAPRRERPYVMRLLRAHSRLFGAALCGAGALVALPHQWQATTRSVVARDIFAALYLGLVYVLMVRAETAAIRRRAIHEDEGRLGILVLAVMAAVASLGVIGAEMRSPGGPLDLAMLGITIFLSWALIHTVFAIHYAHAYYDCDDSQSDTNDGQAGGFVFPGNAEPDYLDFVYVSFVIGMTSQVSDVAVTSRSIRRTVLVHSVIAFAFNTALLALAINLAASAVFGK